MTLHQFNRNSVLAHSERCAGVYVIGHLEKSRLRPLYVGRSDVDGNGKSGRAGIRGRVLDHLTRADWQDFQEQLTHFATFPLAKPMETFEAECWHYHHYHLPLNGGTGLATLSAHPVRPIRTPNVCPEKGCFHHHAEAAAVMKAVSLHAQGAEDGSFFQHDWESWRVYAAKAQWEYEFDPQRAFHHILIPPLKRAIRKTEMHSGESFQRLYQTFVSCHKKLKTLPPRSLLFSA